MSARYRHPTIELIREWHGDLCHICGELMVFDGDTNAGLYATRDHIVPKREQGTNGMLNLLLAHRLCNNERGHRPIGHLGKQFRERCRKRIQSRWRKRLRGFADIVK